MEDAEHLGADANPGSQRSDGAGLWDPLSRSRLTPQTDVEFVADQKKIAREGNTWLVPDVDHMAKPPAMADMWSGRNFIIIWCAAVGVIVFPMIGTKTGLVGDAASIFVTMGFLVVFFVWLMIASRLTGKRGLWAHIKQSAELAPQIGLRFQYFDDVDREKRLRHIYSALRQPGAGKQRPDTLERVRLHNNFFGTYPDGTEVWLNTRGAVGSQGAGYFYLAWRLRTSIGGRAVLGRPSETLIHSGTRVRMESVAFNRHFRVFIDYGEGDVEMRLRQALTPAAQEVLVALAKQREIECVFEDDAFIMKGRLRGDSKDLQELRSILCIRDKLAEYLESKR